MAFGNQTKSRKSLGVRTSSGTTATAAAELIVAAEPASGTISVSPGVRVVEIRICMAAATASIFGIGRPAAIGVTPTTPVFLLGEDNTAASTKTSVALAWATGPTIPAAFIRRANLPATIGVEQIFSFGSGILVPAGSSLVVWNAASNGIADVNFVVEEI